MGINQQDKDVADKIQKLLAKAESTSHEHEADAFKSKAKDLMQKHDLSRGDVEQSEYEMRRWEHPYYSSAPKWYQHLWMAVSRFLGVYCAYDSGRGIDGKNATFLLGGQPRDIDMTEYLVEAIANQVDDLLEQYKDECGDSYDRSRGNAYKVGLMQRLRERLQDMVDHVSDGRAEKGLVKASEIRKKRRRGKEAVRNGLDGRVRFEKGSGASVSDQRGVRDGYSDGDDVSVHKGAPDGANSPNALPS
jgi:ElaB/YqjD/DUF883 family membrane-anchored ribosome-binding protein